MWAGCHIKRRRWNHTEPRLPHGPGLTDFSISVCVCEKNEFGESRREL